MSETLEELEEKYFMLEMQDTWSSRDYKYADELKETIKKLAQERPTLRFACCEWLLKPLLECGIERSNIDILQIGTKYNYKLFKIVPIKLYHDVPQCGYRVLFEDYKVIYMTDTKTVEGISAKNYDLYLVEGNYDEDEIEERIKKNNKTANMYMNLEQKTAI